jgi:hypothetical protein
MNGPLDVYRGPALRSSHLANYAPASLCALQHYDGISVLQTYAALTQQGVDWRSLTPDRLFEAMLPPITGGEHNELKRKSA